MIFAARLISLVCWLLAVVAFELPASGQEFRAPPPRSVHRMAQSVRLGQGPAGRAFLRMVVVDHDDFHPYTVQVELEGQSSFDLARLEMITDETRFELELPPGARIEDRGAALSAVPPGGEIGVTVRIERHFSITERQVRLLAGARSLEVVLRSSAGLESRHVLGDRQLRRLKAWLQPWMERLRAPGG